MRALNGREMHGGNGIRKHVKQRARAKKNVRKEGWGWHEGRGEGGNGQTCETMNMGKKGERRREREGWEEET